MGEEKLQALIQESLSVASRTDAIKPSELSRVIVNTTVQPKNAMFPTEASAIPSSASSPTKDIAATRRSFRKGLPRCLVLAAALGQPRQVST